MHRLGLALISLALAACSSQDTTSPTALSTTALLSQRTAATDQGSAAVYTLTNSTTTNAVRAFARANDGSLTFVADYPTGGAGTGGGLGNQGAIVFAHGGRVLLAVNPGSNSLSSFRITPLGLTLVNTVASGGMRPVSVTSSRDVVYVLNAGGTGNISGFRLDEDGAVAPIANSSRALSSATAGAAQIEFAPEGEQLVVTEKATNNILTYQIGNDDLPATAVVHASAGRTPFGFEFTERGLLIVSEAFGGAAGASAASSYQLKNRGRLEIRTASAPTTQSAACWVVITPNNRFAYLTNTGSNTITGYRIAGNGSLARLDPSGITATTDAGPIDAAMSRGGRYLYALNSGSHTISVLRVHDDGALTTLGTTPGVPVGATGLIAR